MTACSNFELKITETEVDYMIRRLLKYFHIPETDEEVKIVIKLLRQQADVIRYRDKILSFLDRFKVKLP